MKVFIKGNLVDLEAPIYATEQQRDKIIKFFKSTFPDIRLKEVTEPDRVFEEREAGYQHKWVAKDYLKLFSSEPNESIADEFGLDTGMGPQVKRGTFIMPFLKWKRQKGNLPLTEKTIQQFLDEVEP